MAIIAALAAVLAACTAPGGVPADDPRSTPIPALQEFHTQELAWEDCAEYAITAQDEKYFPLVPEAECARMLVPMDYADPEGDTASIAVVRVPARGESQGSLFFNPGGPGGAGLLGTIGASSLMTESAVTESFDLIGFDPRGVGATEPAIDCKLTDGSTEGADLLARIGSPIPTLTEEDTKELADRCAEGSGGMEALANVGTRTTAKDMDVLRAVLGEDELNFLGQSYGTRLGAIYAEEFPENVRAMILDGRLRPGPRLAGASARVLQRIPGLLRRPRLVLRHPGRLPPRHRSERMDRCSPEHPSSARRQPRAGGRHRTELRCRARGRTGQLLQPRALAAGDRGSA